MAHAQNLQPLIDIFRKKIAPNTRPYFFVNFPVPPKNQTLI